MKHTIKLLTLAAILTAVFGLTGCPGPVNNYIEPVWDNGVVTTEPTCTTEGVKTYTCSNGETRTESIPALGHNFGEWSNWTTTREVAYDHDGEKEHTRTCTRCGHSETVKATISRFVAGGYDGNDVPTENEETYRYQYNGGNDYQIEIRIVESSENISTFVSLYFSFPSDTTALSQYSNITIDVADDGNWIRLNDLIHMKPSYSSYSIKEIKVTNTMDFISYSNSQKSLSVLDSCSPIYVILE